MKKLTIIIMAILMVLALAVTSWAATYAIQRNASYYVLPTNVSYERTYTFPYGLNVEGTNVVVDNNVTVDYFSGQPIDGGMGSGVIWADAVDSNANLNLSHDLGTLNVTYPDFIVRLARTDNTVTYCPIASREIVVPNDQHTVFYIDGSCALKNVSIATYLTTDLSPGGIADIFNAVAHSNDIDAHQGVTILGKAQIQNKKTNLYTENLAVVSGLGITTEIFPGFFQAAGKYNFIDTVVDATEQNATDEIEIVSHDGGPTTWGYFDNAGLNLTHCDNTTDLVACSNNQYRRYVIFTVGFQNADDETEIHQLAPVDTDDFVTIGGCLDIEANPISYTLPDQYVRAAVTTFMYCGRRDDTVWTANFIDLRQGTSGFGATVDTSIFLTKDGTRPLTADWNAGNHDITADNFLGSLTGNWTPADDLDMGGFDIININTTETTYFTDGIIIITAGDLIGADDINTTELYVTNLYATNLEKSLDGTGFTVTAGTFTDGVLTITGGDIIDVDDVNATEVYATTLYGNLAASYITAGTFGAGDFTFQGLLTANEFAGNQNWTDNQNYPAACPGDTFLTQLEDTVTCTAIDFSTLTDTHTHDAAGNITNEIWVDAAGDDMAGDLNMTGNDIFNVNDLYVANLHGGSDINIADNINMSQGNITTNRVTGDVTGDLTGTASIATTWDSETSQANLNVNSTNYWDSYGTAPDLNNLITIQGENITGGTIAFEILPTLASTHTHNAENVTAGTFGSGTFTVEDIVISSTPGVNITNAAGCFYVPGGGKLCGNTTCITMTSPDGGTILQACN